MEVEEYHCKGYSDGKVKSGMFPSLKGQPQKNFQDCDEDGELTPAQILMKMDGVYNSSIAFWDQSTQ